MRAKALPAKSCAEVKVGRERGAVLTSVAENSSVPPAAEVPPTTVADAAIAEAIANLSGLRFIAIDRCDVMDTGNRLAFLKWLHGLAASGEIDTALVFGTFKSLPTVPATFMPVWIERGAIVQHKEAA